MHGLGGMPPRGFVGAPCKLWDCFKRDPALLSGEKPRENSPGMRNEIGVFLAMAHYSLLPPPPARRFSLRPADLLPQLLILRLKLAHPLSQLLDHSLPADVGVH